MKKQTCECGRVNPATIWDDSKIYTCDQCKEIAALKTKLEAREREYQDLFKEFGVQNAELAKHIIMMDEALDRAETAEAGNKWLRAEREKSIRVEMDRDDCDD